MGQKGFVVVVVVVMKPYDVVDKAIEMMQCTAKNLKLVCNEKLDSGKPLNVFELKELNVMLENIADFLATKGIKTSGGLPLKKDQIKYMLTNPFYYGHFRYCGEDRRCDGAAERRGE